METSTGIRPAAGGQSDGRAEGGQAGAGTGGGLPRRNTSVCTWRPRSGHGAKPGNVSSSLGSTILSSKEAVLVLVRDCSMIKQVCMLYPTVNVY